MTTSIRKRKGSLTEIKIAVVGAPRVGKTALVEGEPVLFEILDTCPKDENEMPNTSELIQWAEGLLLVYSATDRNSFNYIRRVKSDLQSDIPVQLVANKNELTTDEGKVLAKDFECKFCEVSAAEQVEPVAQVFYDLCKELPSLKQKSKQSLLERIFSRGKSDGALTKDFKPVS